MEGSTVGISWGRISILGSLKHDRLRDHLVIVNMKSSEFSRIGSVRAVQVSISGAGVVFGELDAQERSLPLERRQQAFEMYLHRGPVRRSLRAPAAEGYERRGTMSYRRWRSCRPGAGNQFRDGVYW